MSAFRRLRLPALIAVLVVAELITATVGASHLRADQRKAAAIAAEKRAVAAYRVRLRPVVEQVYDAVQPLQDSQDAFAHPVPGLVGAQNDVLSRSGAVASLGAASATLRGLAAPRQLTTTAATLRTTLARLTSAAQALAAATTTKGDAEGYIAAFGAAFDLLSSAETDWTVALQDVLGRHALFPSPSADRVQAHGRRVPTHGGFIEQADLACARGFSDLEAQGKIADLATAVRVFPQQAAIARRTARKLLTLRADPRAAGFQHRLGILLTAHEEFPRSLEALASAGRHRDQAAYTAALRRFEATFPTLRDLSRALSTYGARLCGNYYNVDDLLAPKGRPGTLTA